MRRSAWLAGGVAVVTAAAAMLGVYRFAVRRYASEWGSTAEERARSLPGDELVARPRVVTNNAITISAPASAVWPWLVQIGCGRGGWYSYDGLDNAGIPSATRVLPEFQDLEVGDEIKMTPDGSMAIPVAMLEAPRYLVLGGLTDPKTHAPVDPADPAATYFGGTWGFFVEEVSPDTTRLLLRMRLDWNESPLNRVWQVLDLVNFIMSQRMLKNLKARIEAAGA